MNPFAHDDLDLLRRFRDGDRAALHAVYQAYVEAVSRAVAGALRRYGGDRWRAIALELPDLVQDVFARAFEPRTRRRFDGLREYGPYLGQIARNAVVDHLRQRRRRVNVESELVLEEITLGANAEPSATDNAIADEHTMMLVNRYVAGLSAELRRVHEALYVQGLSQRDAARALGLGRQVVRTMEAKLREGLRGVLSRVSHANDPAPAPTLSLARPAAAADFGAPARVRAVLHAKAGNPT